MGRIPPSRSVRSSTRAHRLPVYTTRQNAAAAPNDQTATAPKKKPLTAPQNPSTTASKNASAAPTKKTPTRRNVSAGPKTSNSHTKLSTTNTVLWKREERIVLHLLVLRYPTATAPRLRLFNKVFEDVHPGMGFPNGREWYSLRSQYGDRVKKGRKACWEGILDGKGEKEEDWEGWRRKIREAEEELGMDFDGEEDGEESELTEFSLAEEEKDGDGNEEQVDDSELTEFTTGTGDVGEKDDSELTEFTDDQEKDEENGQEESELTEFESFNENVQDPPIDEENPDSEADCDLIDEEVNPNQSPPKDASIPHQEDSILAESSNVEPQPKHRTLTSTQPQPSSFPPAPLPQLHSTQIHWAGNQAYLETHDLTSTIPLTSPIYKVHRVFNNRGHSAHQSADYMICDASTCSVCSPNTQPPKEEAEEVYPFVHSVDIKKIDDRLVFAPAQNVDFDRHFSPVTASWPRSVVFSDGKGRITEVCIYQKCQVCAAAALARRLERDDED